MESKHSCLGSSIIGCGSNRDEACHTGNSDDMTFVCLDHIWTKGSAGVEVTGHVDCDNLLQEIRVDFEDRCTIADSSVVYEDRGGTEVLPDLVCSAVDCIDIGNIASNV